MYSNLSFQAAFPQYILYEQESEISNGARSGEFHLCSTQTRQYSRAQYDANISSGNPTAKCPSLHQSSDTRDLAEFLRTSCPRDFPETSVKNSSEEQLFSFGSYKKGFKFIRNSASKPKLKPITITAPLPNNVHPKTTSWGKPYLQIQVDYDGSYNHPYTDDSGSNHRTSNYDISAVSSNFTFCDSMIAASTAVSPRQSSSNDRPILSPTSWNPSESTKALDDEIMDTYEDYLVAEQNPYTFCNSTKTETRPRSLSAEATGSDNTAMPSHGNVQPLVATPFKTPPTSPQMHRTKSQESDTLSSSPQHSASGTGRSRPSNDLRSSKRYSGISARSSANSDRSDDGDGMDQLRRAPSRRAPPRPGPPPARGLPALPEVQKISNDRNPAGSHHLRSPIKIGDSCGRSTRSFSSVRCQNTDESDALQQLCKARERRVKARKSRDMQRARSVDQTKSGEETECKTESLSAENSQSSSVSKTRPIGMAIHYPPNFENVTSSQSIKSLKSCIAPGAPTPPLSPTAGIITKFSPKNDTVPATLPSPANSSTNSYIQERDLGMEMRIQAVERKNRMLEQALVAVIRGTVCQNQRQSELQKAKTLEDLLQSLKSIDTHTAYVSTPNTA
jgi:hypothetical protein